MGCSNDKHTDGVHDALNNTVKIYRTPHSVPAASAARENKSLCWSEFAGGVNRIPHLIASHPTIRVFGTIHYFDPEVPSSVVGYGQSGLFVYAIGNGLGWQACPTHVLLALPAG